MLRVIYFSMKLESSWIQYHMWSTWKLLLRGPFDTCSNRRRIEKRFCQELRRCWTERLMWCWVLC